MGRTEPTVVKPPAASRRDARAKRARATANKVIPALLSAHPRARRGIERSELIVDPPPLSQLEARHQEGKHGEEGPSLDGVQEGRNGPDAKRHGGGWRKANSEPVITTTVVVKRENDVRCAVGPRITLCVADTLAAAHSLLDSSGPSSSSPPSTQQQEHSRDGRVVAKTASRLNHKVGVLNMASPLSPGGGFLNGATSQEESLCMRTTLLPALRDEFYRLHELGVVYTPDVLVFRSPASSFVRSAVESAAAGGEDNDERDDVLPKNERWHVDVVSAAMLRLPETEDGAYVSAADRELVVRKMRAVLRIFAAKGCSRVVLGAWGCGAYGNPVAEIAKAWRRVLGPGEDIRDQGQSHGQANGKLGDDKKSRKRRNNNRESWGAFIEEVIFAVKDGNLAAAFAREFGEDVMRVPASSSGSSDNGNGSFCLSSTAGDEQLDPVEIARISELREKMVQLKTQMEGTRSPQMRAGLESVLANLRKQLPAEVDDDGDSVVLGQESSGGLDEAEESNMSEYRQACIKTGLRDVQ
ncbi:hypothetical protein RRF57_009490 [Xylaria bambusicola]|uniref:Microbial-type PARG catalytic domain-containing protein n=1 Tax=Xylaria bambusicola TaxID=326684 RepID=A0AAN7UWW7_9PEZI